MITLYWAPKTRSLRALWMLEEAGASYRLERIDIESPERPIDFLAVNPMRKAPALRDGKAELAESAAICAYLAERFPNAGLAPCIGDPLRGRYFHWLFFAPGCIEPALTEKCAHVRIPPIAAGGGDFSRVLSVLEMQLERGPWILGDAFCAADVMIGADLHFGLERYGLVEPRPSFVRYLNRCKSRPALRRAMEIDAAA